MGVCCVVRYDAKEYSRVVARMKRSVIRVRQLSFRNCGEFTSIALRFIEATLNCLGLLLLENLVADFDTVNRGSFRPSLVALR